MRYVTVSVRGADVTVDDIDEQDVECLVDYWHKTDRAYLEGLGVDVSLISSRDSTRSRFVAALAHAPNGCRPVAAVAKSNGALIGYTLLNFVSDGKAFAHMHLLQRTPLARAAAYRLFPELLRAFFESLPLDALVFQASVDNRGINRMIQRFGIKGVVSHLQKPDGMARPGDFYVYTISRNDLGALQRN